MQKFLNFMWLLLILLFILIVIGGVNFGINSGAWGEFLGRYYILPLLILQVITWAFLGKKKQVE